jgi:hypothetical protein
MQTERRRLAGDIWGMAIVLAGIATGYALTADDGRLAFLCGALALGVALTPVIWLSSRSRRGPRRRAAGDL